MTDVDDSEVLRRHFIAIATAEYDDETWPPLAVRDEVAALRAWWCAEPLGDRRFVPTFPELADNPSDEQIRGRLRTLARRREWTAADAAVVYVTGHGDTADDTHYLVLRETQRDLMASTALRTADLIAWLSDTAAENVLVIVDACYAGRLAADVLRLDRHARPGWLVLPSATRHQQAVTGALTEAITAFLADLRSPEGRRYGEGPYLDIAAFVQDVSGKLAELGYDQNLLPLYGVRLSGPHVCLPNPHYRPVDTVPVADARHDLALPRSDLRTHWGPRSRGVVSGADEGWLFSGRAVLMRELIAAATGEPGATVVTGGAGSGKSAALARLVTLTDERFRDRHRDEVAAIQADLLPPAGAVDVAVVATGKLHTQVLAQICAALGVPDPERTQPEITVEERLTAWYSWLDATHRTPTVVVDAVDEATHPETLVHDVLARLEPDRSAPRIRLLVGVRSVGAGPGAPGTVPGLDAALHKVLGGRRVAVDQEPWWHQDDVVAYVGSILRHTPDSPYQAAPRKRTAAVADVLGRRAGRSFLVARIAAASLAADRSVIAPDDPAWLAALDAGVLGVFRDDLHRSLSDPADRYRAVVLLRAVAFARGPGLPWRTIWPLVAHAVDDDGGYYGDADIAWLLRSRLGAYLVADTADDTTVYRLFHDLLRSTLRGQWRELLTPAARAGTNQGRAVTKIAVPGNSRPRSGLH